MQSTKEDSSSWLSNAISRIDFYYTGVSLYFRGHKRVTSTIGLIATWIVILSMMVYAIYRGKILFEGSEFKTQMSNILRPINYTNTEMRQMNELGFDFAVSIHGPLNFDKEYGQLAVRQLRKEWENGDWSSLSLEEKDIQMERCNDTNFNHSNKDEMKVKGVYAGICPSNKSQLVVGGSSNSNHYQSIVIRVVSCVNSTSQNYTCKTPEEIKDYFASRYVTVLILNYYFDKDDKDEPIKAYIKDNIYFPLLAEVKQEVNMYLSINEAKFYDSIWPWGASHIKQFTTLEKLDNKLGSKKYYSNTLISLNILEDFWMTSYLKEVYTMTDFFSEMGGMFNSIYAFGKLIVFIVADGLFLKLLIEQVYLVRNPRITAPLTQQKAKDQSKNIKAEIEGREPFFIDKSQFIKSVCPAFLCCRKHSIDLKNAQDSQRRVHEFIKGKQMLKQDLDLVEILKCVKEFKILKKVLLTKNELTLLKATKQWVIDFDKDSVRDKANCNSSKRSMMNPIQRIYYMQKQLGKIEKAIEEKPRSVISQQLMSGILSRNMGDALSKDTEKANKQYGKNKLKRRECIKPNSCKKIRNKPIEQLSVEEEESIEQSMRSSKSKENSHMLPIKNKRHASKKKQ